jgi:hypothetical protein
MNRPSTKFISTLLDNRVALAAEFTSLNFLLATSLFNANGYRLQVSTTVNGLQIIPNAGKTGWSYYFIILSITDPNSWRIYVHQPTLTNFISELIDETGFEAEGFYDYTFISDYEYNPDYQLPIEQGDEICAGATKESLNVYLNPAETYYYNVALVNESNNIVNSNIGGLSVDQSRVVTIELVSPLSRPELSRKFINNKATTDLPVLTAFATVNGQPFGNIATGAQVTQIGLILSQIFSNTDITLTSYINLDGFETWRVQFNYSELGLENIEEVFCTPEIEIIICPAFEVDHDILVDYPSLLVDPASYYFDTDVQESGIYENNCLLNSDKEWSWTDGSDGERRSLISYLSNEFNQWNMGVVFLEDDLKTPSLYKLFALAGYSYNFDPPGMYFALASNSMNYSDFVDLDTGQRYTFGFTLSASIPATQGLIVANRQAYPVSFLQATESDIWDVLIPVADRYKYLAAINNDALLIESGSVITGTPNWQVDKDYVDFITHPQITSFQPMIFEGVKLSAGFDRQPYLMTTSVSNCVDCNPYTFVCVDIPADIEEGCYRLMVYEFTGQIEPLAISDIFSFKIQSEESKMVEFSDENGAWGIEYLRGQKQKYRLELFMGNPEQVITESSYRQSNGVHRLGQIALDKQLTVNTGWQPDKFHEAMFFATKHEKLIIDGKIYICVSEYTTETPLDNSSSEGYNELTIGQFKVVAQRFAPLKNQNFKC